MSEGDRDSTGQTEDVTRHIYGPRALGAVLPAVVRPAFRRRAPATAHLISDWAIIVGPMIARDTVPRKLAAGTLSIGCSGPVALELQHLSDALIERINNHTGQKLVQRLRFVQESLQAERPRAAPAADSTQARQAAEQAVRHLPQGGLRDALAQLGAAVLARRK